jgi:hypothetical protein
MSSYFYQDCENAEFLWTPSVQSLTLREELGSSWAAARIFTPQGGLISMSQFLQANITSLPIIIQAIKRPAPRIRSLNADEGKSCYWKRPLLCLTQKGTISFRFVFFPRSEKDLWLLALSWFITCLLPLRPWRWRHMFYWDFFFLTFISNQNYSDSIS